MDTNYQEPSKERTPSNSQTIPDASGKTTTSRAYGTHPAIETQRFIRNELRFRRDID